MTRSIRTEAMTASTICNWQTYCLNLKTLPILDVNLQSPVVMSYANQRVIDSFWSKRWLVHLQLLFQGAVSVVSHAACIIWHSILCKHTEYANTLDITYTQSCIRYVR